MFFSFLASKIICVNHTECAITQDALRLADGPSREVYQRLRDSMRGFGGACSESDSCHLPQHLRYSPNWYSKIVVQ